MSKTLAANINLDTEIKQCAITQPYEALQSDFWKKILDHLAPNSKFKEQYIRKIIGKIDDETETLTPQEWKDFLEFMQENNSFFDGLIKRYQWQFPARVQSVAKPNPYSNPHGLNMKHENHVIYNEGKYLGLYKIRDYVRSRIKGQDTDGHNEWIYTNVHGFVVDSLLDYIDNEDSKRELLHKMVWLNYSNRINKYGITIHNINGITFTPMDNPIIDHTFTMKDLNNDPEDFTKGKSFANLNKNPIFSEILKKSDAKAFESLAESNSFHFKILQTIANQLWRDVLIDVDFLDDPKNKEQVEDIIGCLCALTGTDIWLPYKFNDKGFASKITYQEWLDSPYISHPFAKKEKFMEDGLLSFLLEVDPALGKEKK